MPKRSSYFYFNTPDQVLKRLPRKRIVDVKARDAETNNDENEEEEVDHKNIENKKKMQDEMSDAELKASLRKTKQMHWMRYNQNNEIERLLLHNSSGLYSNVDHCDFPAFNVGMWPQVNQEFLSTYPSCAFSVPRPIYVSDGIQEKIDLCYRRPMTREYHRHRLSFTRTVHLATMKKSKTMRTNEKYHVYHSAVFDVAERILIQPDPYLQSSYDYYYTGGNLCILPETGGIVHATGNNLQTLELSEFPMAEDYTLTSSLRPVAKLKTMENSEIFEIKPMLTSSVTSRQNCFIARQRNLISLNYLNENKNLKIITQFRTKSTPFISFTQSDRDHTKLLLTTMKQHVRLYDIGSDVPRLVKLFEIERDPMNISWNTIKPWRENTFLYANEYKFCLIDIRTTPDQWMKSATSAIEHRFLCDHISAVKLSDFNNIFYVATNHKLHCMDIRHINNSSFNDPDAVICRWTHQMSHAPLMIDTYRIRNNEYIALSSPIAGDLHICELSRQKNDEKLAIDATNRVPKHIYNSSCLPYQPPTLMDAYDCARLEGKCLQPEANLHNRLRACTTGLSFSKPSLEENEVGLGLLLTSNSLGDIFSQHLTKREGQESDSRGNARSNEIMADFAKKLAQHKPPLNYTEIKNMKAMRKVFLCKYLNTNPNMKYDLDAMDDSFSETEQLPRGRHIAPPAKKKRLQWGRWQKSFATLHSYKDALVPDLLSIWDIEMEDEKAVRLGNLQSSMHIKPDPAITVRDWLDTNLNPNPPMITIPRNESLKYVETVTAPGEADFSFVFNQTQDTVDFESGNIVQSTQIVDTTQLDSSVVDPPLNTTTTSMDKSKTKKKSKNYVKGF